MASDPEQWTEAMLGALEPYEHDFQEFKGSAFLADGRQMVSDFRHVVSRQVSAFANGAGGHLFIGIDDAGHVDGGVLVDLKGGGTRAWLEDVIPDSVTPPLRRFNVFEVPGETPASSIRPGRAVYVIHIPASDDAPHQSSDYRYYLRIAGKSRPMGHVHVQDVLHRTRHPHVEITRVGPYGEAERVPDDPHGPVALICFRTFLRNPSQRLARHVGVELILPRPLVTAEVRSRVLSQGGVHLTQRPGDLTFFRYLPNPLFPCQELFFLRVWVAVHSGNLERFRSGVSELRWRIYADDSPAREGATPFNRFAVVNQTVEWVQSQLDSRLSEPP